MGLPAVAACYDVVLWYAILCCVYKAISSFCDNMLIPRRMADKAVLEEQKQAQDLERLRSDIKQERAEAESGLSGLVQQLSVEDESRGTKQASSGSYQSAVI